MGIIGKKINIIISFLANKALLYKDGFDLVKNYYYDFEEEYNKLYEEIKQLIIKNVYKINLVDESNKIEDKTEESKETTQTEETNKEDKKDKKKRKLEKLKEKFGSKDSGNYKKKSNVHRTLLKEKKKKPKKLEKDNKEEIEKEENIKKQNEIKEKYNKLNSMTLEELIKEPPENLSNEILEKLKSLKESIISKIKTSIKEEINSRYFGSKDKLKSICKIYNIEYNDNNPNESIEKYSGYIYKELLELIDGYQNYQKIVINDEKLRKKNST